MKIVEGNVAVVTGAASGIGLAICEQLAQANVHVLMTDRNPDALAEAAPVVRASSTGSEIETLAVDVSDPDAVEAAATRAVERFGALHIAVNNAGVVNRGLSWELSLDEWHRVLDVNLWGVIHGVRAFVPKILADRSPGHVVNVASMAAVLPQDRLGPYTVAKHGVLGLSDVLRAEFVATDAPVGVSVVLPRPHPNGHEPHRQHRTINRRTECARRDPPPTSLRVHRRPHDRRRRRRISHDHRCAQRTSCPEHNIPQDR